MAPSEQLKQSPPTDPSGLAFVKGGKRKRLSKACDACHKSKRRCDGTAPCSNCYFASKECTYTDAAGRPVPAPRNAHPDRLGGSPVGDPLKNIAVTTEYHSAPLRPNSDPNQSSVGVRRPADPTDDTTKRLRPEDSLSPPSAPSLGSSPSVDSGHCSPTSLLDPTTTHELVNLFFAHCNPHRLIIHKPTFSAALSHDKVPSYLILVVCALAAPWSKEISSRAPMPRLAGVPFFQEAVSIMFDSSGRLLSEPSLATAQALCLLEMHEVAASHSWTKHYRYFDLALQLLEEALVVSRPDYQLTSTLASAEARQFITERECIRRCFWLVQTMCWINGIYTYRPMRPRSVDLMRIVRLPVDEMSFELAKTPEPEFLHVPAPRTKTASQFGHVCRMLSMYQQLQTILATKEQHLRPPLLVQCRTSLQTWVSSLPDHLQFTEDTLEKQIAMFETSSNSGAWCYCYIHTLHPCYVLDLTEAEGGLQAEPIEWIRSQLNAIFRATGNRARNTILSACTLWTYSKYYPHDPQVQEWDDEFEKLWGFRVTLVADQWRKTQSEQRSQIGRTYHVDSVSQRDAPPAFAVANNEGPSSVTEPKSKTPKSHASSSSGGSSARSSPKERHSTSYAGSSPPGQRTASHASYDKHVGLANGHDVATATSSRTLEGQRSLPSLKASGLLDVTRVPPTEAFAAASISGLTERTHGHGHSHAHSQPLGRGSLTNAIPAGAYGWIDGQNGVL
ncbi:hypothetical protein BDY19DRAFT_931771 [Irpex rosettiformis]|uniref:Uncharacterized protein n=1 Tax=Irpex rosettiformis TaxID=378272 RepID=A0ACB8UBN9_9APHY|nr:hypothetical protein BDY19DRAFT_931771 [Irpex rosettiformis]